MRGIAWCSIILNTGRKYTGEKLREFLKIKGKAIREGQISREEASERCLADHESRWIHGSRLLGILEELEVTKEEVDEVLEKYREELLEKIK